MTEQTGLYLSLPHIQKQHKYNYKRVIGDISWQLK